MPWQILNNLPLYAEEQKQVIEEEQLTLEQILSKFPTPIPNGFISIEVEHICTTKPNWEGKPLSERYFFIHEEKEIQIDIPHPLLEKLGLEKGQDITQPLYLDPDVLIRKETYKGISIENEEELFLQKPLTINNLEDFLKGWLSEIKTLKEKTTNLEREKKQNQETIANLQTELTQLNNNLQTTQQERDQIQQSLKKSLIGFLLKNKQKVKRISELNDSLSFLRSLLVNNDQEIDNLTTGQNNLQTQINDLNQQVTEFNNLITKVQNLLGVTDLNNLPPLPVGETLNSLLARPTREELQVEKNRVNSLQSQNSVLRQGRDVRPNISFEQWNNTQQELISVKEDRDYYQQKWNNHTCSSSRSHYSSSYSYGPPPGTGKTT